MEIQELKRQQYMYIAKIGGYLNLKEADDTNNDLNRSLIRAYAEKHTPCYLGNINFYESKRKALLEGKTSCYKEYTGETVLNFDCSFVVPVMDSALEQMIKKWNSGKAESDTINKIFVRIDYLDGLTFLWS